MIINFTTYSHYPFGMQMPGRQSPLIAGDEHRYGFNGMEMDDEVKNQHGTSYDFGARMYDPREGRWFSTDAHEMKFPAIAPYVYVENTPIIAIDPDGKDIIVLNAPAGAHGFGHGAVLIGNDKDGWKFYSKNGTGHGSQNSFGSKGQSINGNTGNHFATLKDFANSKHNFHDGEAYYTGAFRIASSDAIDEKMMKAATSQVCKAYDLDEASCIDVPSDALKAGGFDPGYVTKYQSFDPNSIQMVEYEDIPDVPRLRYVAIVKNNKDKGKDVTNMIKPDKDVIEAARNLNNPKTITKSRKYSNDSDNTIVAPIRVVDFDAVIKSKKTLDQKRSPAPAKKKL
jgi:RHS repeat-associated protein